MSMAFIRNKEDFTCGYCGQAVIGNGYTNHCSMCLWSRHVDKEPGDRAAGCRAMMEPVEVSVNGGSYRITHRCLACGYEKVNTSSPEDRFETLLTIVRQTNDRLAKG
ncbi:MAG: RNHCP domain-containing protein [Candidatus Moranbacteria bacterium]|nr:RNHCP domain-containing protein [Candidatus Moranbacteria bacterium]